MDVSFVSPHPLLFKLCCIAFILQEKLLSVTRDRVDCHRVSAEGVL